MLDLTYTNTTSDTTLDQYFPTIEKMFEHALKTTNNNDRSYEMSMTIVDEPTIQDINRDYRQKDAVTDVISFAFLDDDEIVYPDGMPIPLGEIYICRERMYEQAEDYGHGLEREFHFLALHGLLHLLGYDHMTEADEKIMFALQETILDELGYKRGNQDE